MASIKFLKWKHFNWENGNYMQSRAQKKWKKNGNVFLKYKLFKNVLI